MSEQIHVAFILDENYFMPAATSIYSIIQSKAEDTRLVIHLVMDDVDPSLAGRFKCLETDKVSVQIINTSADIYRDLHKFNPKSYCVASTAALLKFSLPQLLEQLDKVIYLDGDLIVRHDLSELWNTDLGDCYVAAAIDSGTMYSKNRFHKMVQGYFNSGVMLLNLAKMRMDSCTERLFKTKKEQKDSNLMDQNIFNIVFDGHVKYVSLLNNFLYVNLVRAREKYNIEQLNTLYDTQFADLEEVYKCAHIVHFSSKDKPWKYDGVPGGTEWREVFSGMVEKYPQLLYVGTGGAKKKEKRTSSAISLGSDGNVAPAEMDKKIPLISVIMTISHDSDSLEKSLASIKAQTWEMYEAIIIIENLTDEEKKIIGRYVMSDDRFLILKRDESDLSARYQGVCVAKGEYVIFMDSHCIANRSLLKNLYMKAETAQSEIVAAHYYKLDWAGVKRKQRGVHSNWLSNLPGEKNTFNYLDCPDRILNMLSERPFSRLYRRDFLLAKALNLKEFHMGYDRVFSAITALIATNISYLEETLMEFQDNLEQVSFAEIIDQVSYVINFASSYGDSETIWNSICRFAIDSHVNMLWNHIKDFRSDNDEQAGMVKKYYEYLHELFSDSMFSACDQENLNSENFYRDLCIIRRLDCEQFKELLKPKMIVSLTSYPARIACVPTVLNTLINQTILADRIELWLSRDEFQDGESGLPDVLLKYRDMGIVNICWCDGNLKPHKKYFYAMQQHKEDIIVTIDDDMTLAKESLKSLYRSYLEFPDAVSALRTHFIMLDEEKNNILPYKVWLHEQEVLLGHPTHALLATGCAGILYPPHTMKAKNMFDEEIIADNALQADDMWLKAIELLSGTKVVQADKFRELAYIDGSQESALWRTNVNESGNDEQLSRIISHVEGVHGENCIQNILNEAWESLPESRIEIMLAHFQNKKSWLWRKIRNSRRDVSSDLDAKLKQTYAEKSELNAKLKQTYAEKSEINAKLKQTYAEKSELNAKLKQTYAEKSEINAKLKQTYAEKSEINAKLKQTYAEKSELNAKLKQTYQEKAERGIVIKELQDRLSVYEPWREGEASQDKVLIELLENSPTVVLFGCGDFGKKLHGKLKEIISDGKIVLCDNNEFLQGTALEGKSIKSLPEVLRTVPEKSIFLVATTRYAAEIYAQLLFTKVARDKIIVVTQEMYDALCR